MRIRGRNLHGGDLHLDASRSSQFLSALLLVAPRLDGVLRVHTEGQIVSEPYIAMTMSMMNAAGVRAVREGNTFSGAAVLLAAAAISGGEITVRRLATPSLQGDAAIAGILEQCGATVERNIDELRLAGGPVRAVELDMNHVPDLVPVTAVVCMFAEGVSRLRNIAHLAYKESDRLEALIGNAARLGGYIYRDNNDLVIEPRPLHGACIDSHGDHRIAMSFALAGLRVPGIEITQPECVEKSYPDFWPTFHSLVR